MSRERGSPAPAASAIMAGHQRKLSRPPHRPGHACQCAQTSPVQPETGVVGHGRRAPEPRPGEIDPLYLDRAFRVAGLRGRAGASPVGARQHAELAAVAINPDPFRGRRR